MLPKAGRTDLFLLFFLFHFSLFFALLSSSFLLLTRGPHNACRGGDARSECPRPQREGAIPRHLRQPRMDRLQSESICSRPRPCSVRVCPSPYLSFTPSPFFVSLRLTSAFRVYQGKWSLATRDLERDIIPMCKVEGLGLAPWNVLGGGAFKTDEELSQIKQTGMLVKGGVVEKETKLR